MRYSIEPRIIKYVIEHGFLPFARNLYKKYNKYKLTLLLKQEKSMQKLLKNI